MSKDKGQKNTKKPKAEKNGGKKKVLSAYKSEGKRGEPALDLLSPKSGDKADAGQHKKR